MDAIMVKLLVDVIQSLLTKLLSSDFLQTLITALLGSLFK